MLFFSLQQADETLDFEEQILEAAKSIAAATSALVKSASAAQRELVAQGKVSSLAGHAIEHRGGRATERERRNAWLGDASWDPVAGLQVFSPPLKTVLKFHQLSEGLGSWASHLLLVRENIPLQAVIRA